MPSLWIALRDVVRFWCEQGVRLFRVDNPHTKPFPFWEWMIADIRGRHPDAVFLAEAFTRPKMMERLGKIGFSQSYTYFTWRNEKQEITEYLTELTTTAMKDFYRPHFFVNTPDINPYYLQTSGRSGFLTRAALATTLSGLWGMYQGFEYCEGRALPGREEYLDSEKYEIRVWPDRSDGDIVDEIAQLNAIRKANPALQTHMGLAFHNAFNDQVLWYRKSTPDRSNVLLCAVSLDPHNVQEAAVELPLWEWGLPDGAALEAEDLMRGHRFTWHGKNAAHPPRPVRAALRHLARPSGGGRLMPRNRFSEQVRAPEGPATGLAEARRAGGASQVVLKRDDDPQWYRDAVIYQLHVKSFFDSNDDGVGDFAGLLQKLDYIAELGVDTLWLLPFYPSPRKDDGYDIADYRGVHPDYGTLHDARRFVREAHARGLARHHRAGHQPHQRPAPLVPARPRRPARLLAPQLLRLVRHRPEVPRTRASSSSTPRSPTGPGTRWRRPISGTASTATSRT